MHKLTRILLLILQVSTLTGAFSLQHYSLSKLGVLRFIDYYNVVLTDVYFSTTALVIYTLVITMLLIYSFIAILKKKHALVPLLISILLCFTFYYFLFFTSTTTYIGKYFILIAIMFAECLQMIQIKLKKST